MIKSKVKYIQSLSQKKLRDEDGVFVAEGPKIINELLSLPGMELRELYALRSWIDKQFLHLRGAALEKLQEVDEPLLKRLSLLATPNQVLGIFKKPETTLLPKLTGQIILMTDGIQDPGNMGTIIRCADWFGVSLMLCSRECADAYNPKTVQASMGSIARVSVMVADLPGLLQANKGISVYAATLSGDNLYAMNRLTEGVIVLGNESKGISPELLSLATHHITIPRRGNAESLNAAVAAGIILSHLV